MAVHFETHHPERNLKPTIKVLPTVFVGLCVFALSACAVGGGRNPVMLPLPVGHGLTAGKIAVSPGTFEEHGNVVISCPSDGPACVLYIAADGSATYRGTGGMPTFAYPAAAALNALSGSEKDRVVAGMVSGRYRNVVSSADSPADPNNPLNTSVTKSPFNVDARRDTPAVIRQNVSISARYRNDQLVVDWSDFVSGFSFSTDTAPATPGYRKTISILGPSWKGVEYSCRGCFNGNYHHVLYSDIVDNDDTDYLALAFWIWLPDLTNPADTRFPYAGAAASGNDPFRAGDIVPLAGRATYLGSAAGLYAVKGMSPEFRYFTAGVSLTADFDRDDIHGVVTDFIDPTSNEPIPGALILERDDIRTDLAAFFRSRTTGIIDGKYFRGEWGGQFFGNGASPAAVPGAIAGAFDAAPRYDPNEYLIGVFGARHGEEPSRVPERPVPPDTGEADRSPMVAALNEYSERVRANVARRVALAAVRPVVSSTASTTNMRPVTGGAWNTGVTQASDNSDRESPRDNRVINARYVHGNLVFERIQMQLDFRHHTIGTPEPPGYLTAVLTTPNTPEWQGVEHFSITRSGGRYYSVYYADLEDNADTDYLALGYWAWIPRPGSFRTPFVGATASGNDPFLVEHIAAVSGRAAYEGAANGLYAALDESPAFRSFAADVRLTADFDENSIGGTITDARDSATGEQLFEGLVLEEASIRVADAAFFGSEVRGVMNGKYMEGDWGGQFYGNGLATTDIPVSFAESPGSVAGTFGATSLDGDESLLGVFRAYRE